MRPLRWLLCCMLTAALILPVRPATAAEAFIDDDATPYEPAIEKLAAHDIVIGCGPEQFCPYDPVYRGGTAGLLSRAFDLPATERDYYQDDDGSPREDDINRVAHAGIVEGCDEDAFCATATLRRGQVASMLVRALELPATDLDFFVDGGGTHGDAIDRLAAAGITGGCDATGTRFCPSQQVRRGELAVMVARALKMVPRTQMRRQLRERLREERRERQRVKREEKRERQQAAERRRRMRQRDAVWYRLAWCESGGNWSINTGNGYYGGLQFSLGSWRAVGGNGYPHRASPQEQIRRGKKLKARQGWGAWPSCTRKLGLR